MRVVVWNQKLREFSKKEGVTKTVLKRLEVDMRTKNRGVGSEGEKREGTSGVLAPKETKCKVVFSPFRKSKAFQIGDGEAVENGSGLRPQRG